MLLVVGGNSEIGSATAALIRAQGIPVVTTTRRRAGAADEVQLDLGTPVDTFRIPTGIRCACIFVAVARLAACEADPSGSRFINVVQTAALIDRFVSKEIYTLFLSTNQVFSGDTAEVPADAPLSPVSEYGRQKAEVERLLNARMTAGAPVGILRLAKVVSPGMSLLANWQQEWAAGRSIRAFHDMTLAPTPVDLVALTIADMMKERLSVTAQLSGPRDVTYLEVGRFLARQAGIDPQLVEPVSALHNGMPSGSIPRHTTLDSSYVKRKYGIEVPDAFEVINAL